MSTTNGSERILSVYVSTKYERSKSKINMLNCCAMLAVANMPKDVLDLNWLPKV